LARGERGGGRDELSRTLIAMRRAAGLTQAEAGERTGIGQRKISRFENALYLPTLDELNALLRTYRTPSAAAARLRQIVRDRRSQPRPVRAVIRRGQMATVQDQIKRIEDSAEELRSYQPSLIIGLLQTADYMTTVFRGGKPDDVKAAVTARLNRQTALARPDQRFTLIQPEAAFRCLVGSPRIMADQLDQLASIAVRWPDRVRVGVIPWTTPMPVIVQHGFHLYDQTTAIIGMHSGTTVLTDRHDVDDYDSLFRQFERVALFGDQAATIAKRIAEEYRHLT
jgi:transcriptional regulator with XRE-family HTH domain